MDTGISTLKEWIGESSNIVFFGGAGVSTESGIPDFRSVDGLYSRQWKYPPETILSHSFFRKNPGEFYRFYREKLVPGEEIQPNVTHRVLARLEQEGKLRAIVTQNIDGLHQKAGSRRVIELHGSVHRAYCAQCGKPCPPSLVNRGEGLPRCACGGLLRPEVVLYEEGLREQDIEDAIRYISEADVLIVGGTSLNVYPAAGLLRYYRGHRLALVNRGATPYDNEADLLLRNRLGEVFSQL